MSKSALLFLIPLMGCVGSDPAAPDPQPDAAVAPAANEPGKHLHTLEVDGLTRELIVYVPELDDETLAVPAVMMFHGTSGDGEKFYDISGWREKADEVGLIAVFPSALTHCLFEDENRDGDFDDNGERHITTKWAAGALGTSEMPLCNEAELSTLSDADRAKADHPVADDINYVDAILELLEREYVVDVQRVYASGFSNGAQMTSRLALERADRFAAVAAAAGNLAMDPAPTARPISMAYTVGTLDDRYTEGLGVAEIPITATVFADVPGLGNGVRPLLEMLDLAPTHTYEETVGPGDQTIGTYTFADNLDGADNTLTFVLIEGLGHQYPNGINHPLTMVNPLWAFFESQTLP